MFFELDIIADSRHAPFGGSSGNGDIIVEGIDYTGAAWTMGIATAFGAAASKTITGASAGSEGISVSWDANYVNDEAAVVGASTIRIQIDETAMEALPTATPTSDPKVLYYDILVTPSGGIQQPFMRGKFTVYPGVTD